MFPFTAEVLIFLMLREFYSISLGRSLKVERGLAMAAAAVAFLLVYLAAGGRLAYPYAAASALPMLAIPVVSILRHGSSGFDKLPYLFFGLVYIALPFVLSPLAVFRGEGFDGWIILDIFIIIWSADVGAYVFGTLFGQKPDSRKLAPEISPKKSWWGFWSAILFGFCAALILCYTDRLVVPVAHAAVLGMLVSVLAVCGDLFESLWKRHFGVKDSGDAIPGHGGMLDRFDSSLLAMPVAFIYLILTGLL